MMFDGLQMMYFYVWYLMHNNNVYGKTYSHNVITLHKYLIFKKKFTHTSKWEYDSSSDT